MTYWRTVLVLAFASCGAPAERVVEHPVAGPRSALQQFVQILTRGGFLYGMNGGCEEWFTGPVADETDDENDNQDAPKVRGRFQTRHADAEGKLYEFSYSIDLQPAPLRLTLVSRGSWSPAPGVLMPSDRPGYFILGSGRYCLYTVDVRANPAERASVTVGNETWFLSRDACRASRGAALIARAGCSDHARKH